MIRPQGNPPAHYLVEVAVDDSVTGSDTLDSRDARKFNHLLYEEDRSVMMAGLIFFSFCASFSLIAAKSVISRPDLAFIGS
jgi:hypothetical protein